MLYNYSGITLLYYSIDKTQNPAIAAGYMCLNQNINQNKKPISIVMLPVAASFS